MTEGDVASLLFEQHAMKLENTDGLLMTDLMF